jgi:hypothetical protein
VRPLKGWFTVGALLAIAPIVFLGLFSGTFPLSSAFWFACALVLAGLVVDNVILRKDLDPRLGRLSVIRRFLESLLEGENERDSGKEEGE